MPLHIRPGHTLARAARPPVWGEGDQVSDGKIRGKQFSAARPHALPPGWGTYFDRVAREIRAVPYLVTTA